MANARNSLLITEDQRDELSHRFHSVRKSNSIIELPFLCV